MKHLYEYINEIMDIASVNHAEPQNAKDMFLANIRNAGGPHAARKPLGTDLPAILGPLVPAVPAHDRYP